MIDVFNTDWCDRNPLSFSGSSGALLSDEIISNTSSKSSPTSKKFSKILVHTSTFLDNASSSSDTQQLSIALLFKKQNKPEKEKNTRNYIFLLCSTFKIVKMYFKPNQKVNSKMKLTAVNGVHYTKCYLMKKRTNNDRCQHKKKNGRVYTNEIRMIVNANMIVSANF